MIEVLEMERRWSGASKVRSKSGQGVAFSGSAVAFGAVLVSIGSGRAERGGRGQNGAGTALNVSGGPRRYPGGSGGSDWPRLCGRTFDSTESEWVGRGAARRLSG